jgi:SAM-dependent methyltransferase
MFPKLAAVLFALPSTRRVIDAGAGAAWCFPIEYKRYFDLTLIGVDIDAGEMVLNLALDERIVGDVCASLNVEKGTADLITAYSGVEHFPDNAAFLRNCHEALRPGGRWIGQFPSRYASFAILNRLIPEESKKRLLQRLRPDAVDHIGFKAHYDRTHYSAFRKMAEDAGFVVEYWHPGYFHFYFAFFTPLYLLSLLSGLVRMAFGLRDFATYNLFILRKPGPADAIVLSRERHGGVGQASVPAAAPAPA